eukprot:15070298-Alexandrium_andersonii.AAC.1
MSASLVGSEMCIRDSSSIVFCIDGTVRAVNAGWYNGAHRRVGVAAEEAAVSYTHLTLPTICSV